MKLITPNRERLRYMGGGGAADLGGPRSGEEPYMYSEQSFARKGIIAVMAALALGAASSALAEPRFTRMGPVDMPMPLGNDVARELVPPAPAEVQAATPAPVAATESEVIALRNQVGVLSRRLADVEEQLNNGERELPTTRR